MTSNCDQSKKVRIAYFTTAYPNVSHTFIRREILGLEALGYSISRVALRCGDQLVEKIDESEAEKTLHLLGQRKRVFLWQIIRGLLLCNRRLLRGLSEAWHLSKASERGVLRHLAYVLEALALLQHCHENGIPHVHVHFGTNASAVAMLAKLMGGLRYSMTIHGPDEFDAPIGLSLGRKIREAEFVVAISAFCSSQLKRWAAESDWEKIYQVHCTVDSFWFENSRPVESNAASLVSIGRFSRQKGQLFLLDAYAHAVRAGLRSKLVLIGDGELRSRIEEKIKENNLDNMVQLTGWLDGAGIREHILAARAVVLPSFAEGLPVVLMEAMALMRPVLTTYIAGIPELVIDRQHGWLVVAGDSASLENALQETENASLEDLREMGNACRRRVQSRHAVSVEVGKLDGIFRRHLFKIGNEAIH